MTNTNSKDRSEYLKEWNKANKAKRRYYNNKSSAKLFINKYATSIDLKELQKLLNTKLKDLN